MRQGRVGSIVPMARNLSLFFMAILIVVFATAAGQLPSPQNPYVAALSSKYYYEKSRGLVQGLADRMGSRVLISVLKTEIPALPAEGETGSRLIPAVPASPGKWLLNLVSGVELEDPLTYLKAVVPMMDVTPVTADSLDETGPADILEEPDAGSVGPDSQPTVENKVYSQVPVMALYNTHTSETFELTDGVAHLKGRAGGVAVVAKEIQKAIQERYGIPVAYASVVNDSNFNKSYAESEKTARALIKDYPELDMLFDIHRDGSLTREQCLTRINGQDVAKILIVVGTDARVDNPRWRENLEFARKLAAKMELLYPGLSRGIAIKEGRYNQHLNPHALLVEIGTAKNTTDEAVAGGRLFANVAVALLNDMRAGK